jgi:hypothetical protein
MAVIDREALVNSLFVERYRILRVHYDVDPDFPGCCGHEFIVPNRSKPDSPPVSPENPFVKLPVASFDYMLVIGLRYLPYEPPPELVRIYNGSDFALYRIMSSVGPPNRPLFR